MKTGWALILCLTISAIVTNAAAPITRGVVIRDLAKGLEGAKADIRIGDLVLRWVAAGKQGRVDSPFDLSRLEIETGASKQVVLIGSRAGAQHKWILRGPEWGINSRPNVRPSMLG